MWQGEHFTDFATAAATALLNQFPHELCLTSKNLLAGCLAAACAACPDQYHPCHRQLTRLLRRPSQVRYLAAVAA